MILKNIFLNFFKSLGYIIGFTTYNSIVVNREQQSYKRETTGDVTNDGKFTTIKSRIRTTR